MGHNIKHSDLHYITKAANRVGINVDMPFLDTYLLARQFKELMGRDSLSLQDLAQFYGIEYTDAHRAWCDAEVNVWVYFKLKALFENGI